MRADERTYRQIAEQDYGVLMCASAVGCRKGLSNSAHERGRIDKANVLHFDRADNHVRRTGLRTFLVFIARATHPEWAKLPVWDRLYLTNTWASRVAKDRYKTRIRVEESIDDRNRALAASHRAGVSLRTHNFIAYQWARQVVYTRPNVKTQ